MNADSLYPEADAEISDVLFEELFETDSEEVGSIHADNIYYDEKEDGDIGLESLALELSDNIEGKSPEEAYDYISEAWPALIPLITALAPAVIQAATTLAPMAVKAVGGLVGNLGKSKPVHQPPARPTPVRSAPIQTAPRTYVRPSQVSRSPSCTCAPIPPVQAQIPYQSGPQIPTQTPASAGIGGTLGKIGQGALGTLAGLLSNKNVQGILSGLATKGISQAIKLGNSEASAREGALLGAIEYLAREAQEETFDDQFPDALDYLIEADGEFIENYDAPESRALRFIELFNS